MRKLLQMTALSAVLLMSSCAYVQTHKNVREMGCYYEGHVLSYSDTQLYKQGGRWYISARKAHFKLHYPVVHDSVFRRSDFAPRFEKIDIDNPEVVYHSISDNAAAVLRRTDGYFELAALADEIERSGGEWKTALPGATHHPISAEIHGTYIPMGQQRIPQETPLANRILSNLDFIAVDIPLTVAYNAAIPIMAPFVFFYEFFYKGE